MAFVSNAHLASAFTTKLLFLSQMFVRTTFASLRLQQRLIQLDRDSNSRSKRSNSKMQAHCALHV